MKKIFIFMSLPVLLAGCSTEEESKTKPNPFKEETTSSQVSNQSTTINTTAVTTTKVTTTQKKADFVPGTYVGTAYGRTTELVLDEDGPIMEKPDGSRFTMIRAAESGYLKFHIKNPPTAEMGAPIFVVPVGKSLPAGMTAINSAENDVNKERIYIPGMMNQGVVYVLDK